MTERLEEAIAEVTRLSADEQDRFAEWLLLELHSEDGWNTLFSESQDVLARLGREALDEDVRRETEILDPDAL